MVRQAPVEKIIGALAIDAGGPAGVGGELLHLGGERQAAGGRGPEVERFDAEAVARREKPAGPAIEQHEGKHAVEAREAAFAPLAPGGQDDLGVGAGVERVAGRRELRAQFDVVVDLAIVGDPALAGRIAHRLMTGRAQVENREPPVPEPERGAGKRFARSRDPAGSLVREERRHRAVARPEERSALAVRAPMPHEAGHPLHGGREPVRRAGLNQGRDAAHGSEGQLARNPGRTRSLGRRRPNHAIHWPTEHTEYTETRISSVFSVCSVGNRFGRMIEGMRRQNICGHFRRVTKPVHRSVSPVHVCANRS